MKDKTIKDAIAWWKSLEKWERLVMSGTSKHYKLTVSQIKGVYLHRKFSYHDWHD